MASEGMKGFQEFMINPERLDKILENLERVRARVFR
jgi:multiple sugar transport system substrate-binding protein